MATLRISRDPYGFKKLLVYRKADELQAACASYTRTFPREKTLIALADQMDRSARSVKQNIVEGWKRNSTKEYYEFLGFSIGANAELEEDCDDIIKGRYEMGGRGIKGGKGMTLSEVEKLPFYPLPPHLPLLIQLKLRCKELNMLLKKLQDSLEVKMREPATTVFRSAWGSGEKGKAGETWLKETLEKGGYERLPDGRIVEK